MQKEGFSNMKKKYLFGQMTWPEVKEAVKEERVAVVPVAMIEEHGHHLPVDTDLILAAEICYRAGATSPDDMVIIPAINHGYAPPTDGLPRRHFNQQRNLYQLCGGCMQQPRASRFQKNIANERPWQQCSFIKSGNEADDVKMPRSPMHVNLALGL